MAVWAAGGGAAAGETLGAPVELSGPAADLAAVCGGEERAAGCTGESPFERGRTRHRGLPAPWREVVLYGDARGEGVGTAGCRIAVRLADGWWSGPLAEECQSYGELGGGLHVYSRVRSVRARQLVPGGARELLVRIDRDSSERAEPSGPKWWIDVRREELLVVCGVGSDGTPRCAPPLTTGNRAWTESARGRRTYDRWRVAVDWKGGLRVRHRGGGKPAEEVVPMLGVHPLSFEGEAAP
jgi:hypothetical protein